MNLRMMIEAYMGASRRTAKRAVVRRMWLEDNWMFDANDFHGTWE